jgi:hypothetical protein
MDTLIGVLLVLMPVSVAALFFGGIGYLVYKATNKD